MGGKAGQPPPAGGSAVGASSTTAGLPAPPLQPPSAQSAYTPMPKPGADYGQTQPAYQSEQQAPPPQTAASPTPAAPTNPNAPALPEQGANVPGDVWAPGTGPGGGYNGYGGANGWGGTGGKASKGGMPPGMPGMGAGAAGGAGGGAPTSAQQPGGAGAFQGQYDAIKNKLGEDAAQTFAVKNWGSGGQQAMQQQYGGDTDAYNAAINAHGAGGTQTGIQGRWWGRMGSGIRSDRRAPPPARAATRPTSGCTAIKRGSTRTR